MACLMGGGGGGGGLSKCSKTNDANPTNYLSSFILVKTLACLYTLSTWLNMALYSGQVS